MNEENRTHFQDQENQIQISPDLYRKTSIEDSQVMNDALRAKKFKLPSVVISSIIKNSTNYIQNQEPAQTHQGSSKNADNIVLKVRNSIRRITASNAKYRTQATCQICLKQLIKTQLKSLSTCQHSFCQSCLHQYIFYKVNSFEEVECPNNQCHLLLDTDTSLFRQLPLQIQQKYKKIKQYQISKSQNKRLCPNEHCEGILNVIDTSGPICCPTCNKRFCPKCYFEDHTGDCDPFQVEFFQNNMQYRQCRKCKNVIEKISGCNHITCNCGFQFCYVCGQKWSDDHLCPGNDNEGNNQNNLNNQDNENVCCQIICNIIVLILLLLIMIVLLPLVYLVGAIILILMLAIIIAEGILISSIQVICQFQSLLVKILAIIIFPIPMLLGLKRSLTANAPELVELFLQILFLPCVRFQQNLAQ